MKRLAAVTAAAVLLLASARAHAESPILGATGEAASGLEIGGGQGTFQLRRARTQLRVGIEWALDRERIDVVRVLALGEIEPLPAIGFDAEYGHHLSKFMLLQGGAVGMIAPQSMFGVTAGIRFALPLSARMKLSFGPQISAYFFGSDVPDGTIVVHTLFVAGLDVAF
jgi:hypothetical protein